VPVRLVAMHRLRVTSSKRLSAWATNHSARPRRGVGKMANRHEEAPLSQRSREEPPFLGNFWQYAWQIRFDRNDPRGKRFIRAQRPAAGEVPALDKKMIGLGILAVLAAIFVVAVSVPIIAVTYTVNEPRQIQETYWEKEPYQETESHEVPLIDDKPTIPAGKYVYYSRDIDVSGKQGNSVSGEIVETAGYDIKFYVFDQKGFNAWKNGNSALAYVDLGKVRSQYYRFVPDHSGTYFFVLDNGYSWFTNKVPSITATWRYEETVTKYRDVQKTRTVTQNVAVQKKKLVTILEFITGSY